MDLCYYTGHERVPSVATYRYPSEVVGMTQRRAGTAAAGLTASLFAVEVPSDDHPIGMGRVIGDGGCFSKSAISSWYRHIADAASAERS